MNNEQLARARGVFLADMINYYGVDPNGRRSVAGPACLYHSRDGRKCQIGRYIPDDKYRSALEGTSVVDIDLNDLLPPEVVELGEMFLSYCQLFHDSGVYWGSTYLSNYGKDRLSAIIDTFKIIMPTKIGNRYLVETSTNPPSYIEDFISAMAIREETVPCQS